MPAQRNHRRRQRFVAIFKWVVSAIVAVSLLAFAIVQWRAGRIGVRFGSLYSWTGYYQWISYPSLRAGLSLLGGAVVFMIFSGLWPRRWVPRTRAARWLSFSAVLIWSLSMTGMHLLQIYELPWLLWLIVVVISFLIAFYLTGGDELRPLLGRFGFSAFRPRNFKFIAFSFILMALFLYYCGYRIIFEGQPIMTDAQSQIAQARLLVSGHFTLDISQQLRDAITFPYALPSVPSYAQYPPGHIFLLMPVIMAGLPPQYLNILTGALTLLIVLSLGRSLAGTRAAVVSGGLMLSSPFLILMNSEAMNHSTASMELWAAAFFFMPRSHSLAGHRPHPNYYYFLGGIALAWAGMTRPLTALAHGTVWGSAWLLAFYYSLKSDGLHSPRVRANLSQACFALAGMIPIGLLFMFYNWKTTGNPLVLGYAVSNPELHRLGFHWSTQPGVPSYTPFDAIRSLTSDIAALNWQMFGLAFGSWLLMAAWWIRTRFVRHEIIILSLIMSQLFFYKLYQFHDLFFGPRFLFEVMPGFVLLAGMTVGRTIRGRPVLAGISLILLFILAIGSVADSLSFWPRRFAIEVKKHRSLDQAMQKLIPNAEPLAIIVPDLYAERVGRWFPAERGAPPVWFIPASKEEDARGLPELADVRWIVFDAWVP